MKHFLGLATLLAFSALSSTPALAQAAAPIGFWTTADDGERLMVQPNAQCSFFAVGGVQVAGDCTWDSTSRGGILSIWYPMPLGPAAVRYNIVWIDDNTISVFGDIFYRRQ
ncbi:MAG TPA: hypothetical protein GYA10_07425 [Alphaproteobacteria bacterium]|nr:hypothetical protein [Alphaproteobacteria bacterium]